MPHPEERPAHPERFSASWLLPKIRALVVQRMVPAEHLLDSGYVTPETVRNSRQNQGPTYRSP
ncbi:hypothetical protein GCM10027610_023840 [Dactylosporangium cerinum]